MYVAARRARQDFLSLRSTDARRLRRTLFVARTPKVLRLLLALSSVWMAALKKQLLYSVYVKDTLTQSFISHNTGLLTFVYSFVLT